MTTRADAALAMARAKLAEAAAAMCDALEAFAEGEDLQMLSRQEAAALLSVSPHTVDRWAEDGKLEKRDGNITRRSVKAYIEGKPLERTV